MSEYLEIADEVKKLTNSESVPSGERWRAIWAGGGEFGKFGSTGPMIESLPVERDVVGPRRESYRNATSSGPDRPE